MHASEARCKWARQACRLTLVSLLCIHAVANDKDSYAPLPDTVLKAKTAFLVNDGGPSKLGDAVYRELKDWNRRQIVTDRTKADLILIVTQRDSVEGFVSTGSATAAGPSAYGTTVGVPVKSSKWFLHVLDSQTGEKLWSSDTT